MIGILSGLRAQLWQVFSEFQFIFSFPISTIVKLLSSSFYHSIIYSLFLDFMGSIINLIRFLKDKSSKDSGTGFTIVESQCCFPLVCIWLSWLAILADHMIVFLLLSFTYFLCTHQILSVKMIRQHCFSSNMVSDIRKDLEANEFYPIEFLSKYGFGQNIIALFVPSSRPHLVE